ncbi:MAG: hypothetical protein KC416_00250 [Myxococcales bacterium]|nr:hypothetical protein [Myxococcales bacterium]
MEQHQRMQKKLILVLGGAMLWLGMAGMSAPASAQDTPDVRDILPRVLIAVDSSGSMERYAGCDCTYPDCVCPPGEATCKTCLPRDITGECDGTTTNVPKNKWHSLVEILTGTYTDFTCQVVPREPQNSYQHGVNYANCPSDETCWTTSDYDSGYHIPHIVRVGGVGGQQDDGLFDSWNNLVEFSFMSFDTIPALTTTPPPGLIPSSLWTTTVDDSTRRNEGGYSYGPAKVLNFPGCPEPGGYKMNLGARDMHEWFGTAGRLYPFPSSTEATDPGIEGLIYPAATCNPGDKVKIPLDTNAGTDCAGGSWNTDPKIFPWAPSLQETVKEVRPFGHTPIAAMLEDIIHYFSDDSPVTPEDALGAASKDSFGECRNESVILITDGAPNLDFRGEPFFCESYTGGPPGTDGCPFRRPIDAVEALVGTDTNGDGVPEGGVIRSLYVVGFDLDETSQSDIKESLDDLAKKGGSSAAYFPETATELKFVLDTIVGDQVDEPTSRTLPAFNSGFTGGGGGFTSTTQSQFNSGFKAPGGTKPWHGILERRRFECEADGQAHPQPVEEKDLLHRVISTQRDVGDRRLWSGAPYVGSPAEPEDWVANGSAMYEQAGTWPSFYANDLGTAGEDIPLESSIYPSDFVSFPPEPELIDLTAGDNATRDEVVAWVAATLQSGGNYVRPNALGDIVRSTPRIVKRPGNGIGDDGYEVFRTLYSRRPTVMYTSTNDGILHAIMAEDYNWSGDTDLQGYERAGYELWGFIPPATYDKLNDLRSAHHVVLDGAATSKDVNLARVVGETSADQRYRTILLTGMGGGGRNYIAMDVTNPIDVDCSTPGPDCIKQPLFLWQFTHTDMGRSYPVPALTQARITDPDAVTSLRAIAILPGGRGTLASAGTADLTSGTNADSAITRTIKYPGTIDQQPRTSRRDWSSEGRSLYIVDVATGRLLRKWDSEDCGATPPGTYPTCIVSPMVGSVSVYPGGVGTVADYAYTVDADGVLWKLDLRDSNPENWKLTPIHDIYSVTAAGTMDVVEPDSTVTTLTAAQAAKVGRPSFGAPLLTIDEFGKLVIILATGDLDKFSDSGEVNRIVSITDTVDPDGNPMTQVNWETTLIKGEKVTGPPTLYEGGVYFATFQTQTSATDQCPFGFSRLCGFNYQANCLLNDPGNPSPECGAAIGMAPQQELYPGILDGGACEGAADGPYTNQIINGVYVTERPTCVNLEDPGTDFFGLNAQFKVEQYKRGKAQLVAQIGGNAGKIVGGGGENSEAGSIGELNKDLEIRERNITALSWVGSAY